MSSRLHGLRSKEVALVALVFLMLAIPFATPAHGQTSDSPVAQVTTNVLLTPSYDAFGGGSATVNASVDATSLPGQGALQIQLLTSFRPVVTGYFSANGVNQTISGTSAPTPTSGVGYTYSFTLPSGTTSFHMSVEGVFSGTSLLWRYLSNVPVIVLSSSGAIQPDYTTTVTVPSGTVLSQMYTGMGQALPLPTPHINGSRMSFDLPTSAGLLVFQSESFVPAAIAITAIVLTVIAFTALGFFAGGELLLRSAQTSLRSAFVRPLGSLLQLHGGRSLIPRKLFQPRKLLAIFLLCAFLMAAVAAVGGPDPRVKAYVIAAPGEVPQIQASLVPVAASIAVTTPAQDFSDFAVMSSVGQFNMVVVSNYPGGALPEVSSFVLPNLSNVPLIIVDSTANKNLSEEINALYPNKVINVGNAASLTGSEQQDIAYTLQSELRTNVVGIHPSHAGFNDILALEAVLSFFLVFLGWAFLGSLASEALKETELSHLVMVIGSGIFVFVFSEVVYVTVSTMLAFPLSLHAVLSGAHDITAVGLLGFGGGSTPRLAAGFLGILVGVVAAEGSPKISKRDFALILSIALLLLADPFAVGQFAYQGLLLFVGNYSYGGAYQGSLSLKSFIYGVGNIFGGSVTPTYLMSAGKMLYFSGLVPFAYLKRMGPTTRAIALLIAAVMLGDGGVRVGEMTPNKTVIAVLPGLFVGFTLLVVILGLSLVEKYVRGRWRSSR